MLLIMLPLVLGPSLLLAQKTAAAKTLWERKYKEGGISRYKLTCEEYQNGAWASTTVSTCELTTVFDSAGIPSDGVQWKSLKWLSPKDTIDETSIAGSTPRYYISLDPRGSLHLPNLEVGAMTEPITDFHTFFVAVSPQFVTASLQQAGDSVINPNPVKGDFGNGKSILRGEDCLQVSERVVGISEHAIDMYASFMPPSQICLEDIVPEMDAPAKDGKRNNFQMVMPAGGDKLNLQFGEEYFTIHSVIRRADGKLESAEMSNQLALTLKVACDTAYGHCQGSFPVFVQRKLKLELLDE